ncbi:hypothetical protein H072_986 [Dactylellina haptotyla CBS 200.50]|uniref:Uncharacterized protein n=1 Tax=Dactylellina haptotyla (strain CBS 200.50) TaxID=1284197 RepID=S8AVJ2_DACHA|nr:hypothetical protein H072_986 [Dactylellina haptotyla CBS 200.50]
MAISGSNNETLKYIISDKVPSGAVTTGETSTREKLQRDTLPLDSFQICLGRLPNFWTIEPNYPFLRIIAWTECTYNFIAALIGSHKVFDFLEDKFHSPFDQLAFDNRPPSGTLPNIFISPLSMASLMGANHIVERKPGWHMPTIDSAFGNIERIMGLGLKEIQSHTTVEILIELFSKSLKNTPITISSDGRAMKVARNLNLENEFNETLLSQLNDISRAWILGILEELLQELFFEWESLKDTELYDNLQDVQFCGFLLSLREIPKTAGGILLRYRESKFGKKEHISDKRKWVHATLAFNELNYPIDKYGDSRTDFLPDSIIGMCFNHKRLIIAAIIAGELELAAKYLQYEDSQSDPEFLDHGGETTLHLELRKVPQQTNGPFSSPRFDPANLRAVRESSPRTIMDFALLYGDSKLLAKLRNLCQHITTKLDIQSLIVAISTGNLRMLLCFHKLPTSTITWEHEILAYLNQRFVLDQKLDFEMEPELLELEKNPKSPLLVAMLTGNVAQVDRYLTHGSLPTDLEMWEFMGRMLAYPSSVALENARVVCRKLESKNATFVVLSVDHICTWAFKYMKTNKIELSKDTLCECLELFLKLGVSPVGLEVIWGKFDAFTYMIRDLSTSPRPKERGQELRAIPQNTVSTYITSQPTEYPPEILQKGLQNFIDHQEQDLLASGKFTLGKGIN